MPMLIISLYFTQNYCICRIDIYGYGTFSYANRFILAHTECYQFILTSFIFVGKDEKSEYAGIGV